MSDKELMECRVELNDLDDRIKLAKEELRVGCIVCDVLKGGKYPELSPEMAIKLIRKNMRKALDHLNGEGMNE